MFKAVQETDRYDRGQTRYYLTQGDSATIYATPYKNGEKLELSKVEKCLFKLSNDEFKEEFVKEMVVTGDKFVLRLLPEETAKFKVGLHIYEIEYTLVGGAVNTPNQWKFNVVDQII